MFIALLITVAYIFALIAGGKIAAAIDAFIYYHLFPVIFVSAVILTVIGIVHIYLSGYRTFRFEIKKNGKEKK